MAFKFALIAALCVAQGFALKPMSKPFFGNEPCKHSVSEEIPHAFEETMQEMDEVRETVSMAAMDAYLKGDDPKIIIACFKEQKENYVKLGQKLAEMMRKASEEIRKDLGNSYDKWAEKAKEPINKITTTIRTLPAKMWEHIKKQEFTKALEVMKEARKIVYENSKILAEITQEMAQEFPEIAKKAEKMAREIHETARAGSKAIAEAIHKCIEQGGPKIPIDDVDIENELPEPHEH